VVSGRLSAVLEAPAVVAGLDDVAVVCESIEQTKGVNPAVLKATVVGLRKMKVNLSSSLAEAAE